MIRDISRIVTLAMIACGFAGGCLSEQRRGPDEDAFDSDGAIAIGGVADDPKLDVGGGASNAAAPGCDKVDFLFVIDNSGSMADEQQNLINSFPGFISTIEDTLQAQDYHLMVIDTDARGSQDIGFCAEVCASLDTCGGVSCDAITNPSACDEELGGGKIRNQFGADCGIEAPRRYVLDTQPDLDDTFACVARVGTVGDGDERQTEAILTALSPSMTGAGACNEGFLRSDALLVVTLITDEEDGPSGPDADLETPSGDPRAWYEQLVALKGGDPAAVVMLGLIGDTDASDALCEPLNPNFGSGAEPSPRLRSFVEAFPNNVLGSVCEHDYAPFFAQAVSVIDSACNEYVPVG